MTTVRIAHIEPWPGKRMGGRGFGISSFLVVLADDSGGRALPVWLNGPEGHGLFRGQDDHPHPEPAEVITAGLRPSEVIAGLPGSPDTAPNSVSSSATPASGAPVSRS